MARILLVTVSIVGRSGTEVVTYETARGLRNRGHEVAVFCPLIGPLAEKLRADNVTVVSDINAMPWAPDIIQTNQTPQVIEAVGRFPNVPIVAICHSATAWYSEPMDIPTIRKHLAVDLACRERIARRFPHLADNIELLHNAVDLDFFRPREPLPPGPKRALILTKQSEHIAILRQACAKHGMSFDTLGPGIGKQVDDLPSRLLGYDVVFATARMAIEALAVGCAVVVVDARGLAGMVTSDVVSSWRDNNFGLLLLTRKVSVDGLVAEMSRYDANDAALVSNYIRQQSSLCSYLERLERIHQDAIAQHAANPVNLEGLILGLSKAFSAISSLEHQTQVRDWIATISQFDAEANHAKDSVRRAEEKLRGSERELELTKGELTRVQAVQKAASRSSLMSETALNLFRNALIYFCCLYYLEVSLLRAVVVAIVATVSVYLQYGHRWIERFGFVLLVTAMGVWIGVLPPVHDWPELIGKMRAEIAGRTSAK